ncbi:MAG TPA: hypothetical protein PKG52_00170 [bacterium]|nr:hypothetical protein [bacterium]HPS28763.1 hypothetical protein [bacterium]
MGIKVGQYFVELGLITEKNVEEALEYQKKHPNLLGEILLQMELIKEIELLHYLSKRFNVQYVSAEKMEKMPMQRPADIIPEKMAEEKNIFPLKYSFNNFRLTILTSKPQDLGLFDELKVLLSGVNSVVPVAATSKALKALIYKQYRGDISSFDRLIKKGFDLNIMTPGNESILGFDSRETISSSVKNMMSSENDNEKNDNGKSFSMILNHGEIINTGEKSSVTASMISMMPGLANEKHSQLIEIIRVFSNLLDSSRDDSYFGHTQRVSVLTQELGEELNLSEVELYDLLIASLLHDVGKKYHLTALDILQRSNSERFAKYSQLSAKLFGNIELSKLTLMYLSNMYETYNGRGFPNALQLDEVPMGSLILLLSDTYDYITRISNIQAASAYKQLKESMFFPEKLMTALKKVQQIETRSVSTSENQYEALIISRKRFDIDDVADKLNRLNVKTYKAEMIEKAAQIIKDKKTMLDFILCDIDMPDSDISPIRLLAALKHKKDLSEIPFFFFSQFSIDKNTMTSARALKANGIFPNYHPIEMTRKIIEEIKRLKNDDRTS